MTNDRSLHEIERLLLSYPGLDFALVFRSSRAPNVRVRFRCTNTQSLESIAQAAFWSNVRLTLGDPAGVLCGEDERAHGLPCDASIADADSDRPSAAEIFGVWLAEDLEERGVISEAVKQTLHKMWNASLPTKIDP